ncbi:MAG: hypothetical protein ACOCRX_01355 [Candidatus Woesearchaeota archaeon]
MYDDKDSRISDLESKVDRLEWDKNHQIGDNDSPATGCGAYFLCLVASTFIVFFLGSTVFYNLPIPKGYNWLVFIGIIVTIFTIASWMYARSSK